jgi:hypothetical protein
MDESHMSKGALAAPHRRLGNDHGDAPISARGRGAFGIFASGSVSDMRSGSALPLGAAGHAEP